MISSSFLILNTTVDTENEILYDSYEPQIILIGIAGFKVHKGRWG